MATQRTNARTVFGTLILATALAFGCGDDSSGDDDDDGADAGQQGDPCDGVSAPADGDGCCPSGATANTDSDCAAMCGNGELEEGEQCDDGNTNPGDGCDGACAAEITPTALRVTALSLADPHTFALGFLDVTETVNEQFADFIALDLASPDDPETPDGLLDFSLLAVFQPFDTDNATTGLEIVLADCTAPADATSCSLSGTSQVIPSVANNMDASCIEVMPDTAGGYNPPITTPGGPCFVSDSETFDIQLGDLTFSFIDARIAAMYADTEGNQLASGLLRGFLTEEFADGTVLPDTLPVIGGKPLSDLLKDTDKDTGPGGETGWYFYLHFSAEMVPFSS